MYKLRLYLYSLLWAVAFAAGPAVAQQFCAGKPCPVDQINHAYDRDGDDLPDYIACGDYDNDGTLEITDINACLALLTDTPSHIYVTPGSYAAPAAVVAGQARGLIELTTGETLECASADSVTLNGANWVSGATATGLNRAVIANSTDDSEENITIRNCGINGNAMNGWEWTAANASVGDDTLELQDHVGDTFTGVTGLYGDHGYQSGDGPLRLTTSDTLPTCNPVCVINTDYWIIRVDGATIQLAATYANAVAETPALDITNVGAGISQISPNYTNQGIVVSGTMGIYTRGIDNLIVQGNKVRNTSHSCIYISDTENFLIDGNDFSRCGAWGSIATGTAEGIYIFSESGNETRDGMISNNRCSYTEGTCYNARANDFGPTGDRIDHVDWINNAAYRSNAAMTLSGTRFNRVLGFTSDLAGAVLLQEGSEYLEEATTASNDSNKDTYLSNIVISNMSVETAVPALRIREYNDGVTIVGARIFRTGAVNGCLRLDDKIRNVAIFDTVFDGCGTQGLYLDGARTSPAEKIIIRNLVIRNTDYITPQSGSRYPAVYSVGDQQYLDIDGMEVSGCGETWCMYFTQGLSNSIFRNISGFGTPSMWFGSGLAGAAPVCNALTAGIYYQFTDASNADSCVTGGASTNTCQCVASAWGDVDDDASGLWDKDMINVAAHATVCTNNVFENISGAGFIDGYTIDIVNDCTNSRYSNISAFDLGASDDGTDYQIGALNLATGSTGSVVDSGTLQCLGTSGTCLTVVAHSDLSAESVINQATQPIDGTAETCDTACTGGMICIDSDDADAEDVLWICENGTYVAVETGVD